MRKLFFLLCFCLIAVLPAWAAFCAGCGQKLEDTAKFCPKCGMKIEKAVPGHPADAAVKPAAKNADEARIDTKAPRHDSMTVYRAKTDLFVYQRRGDEHNILKKNFLFKPRRYKIAANSELRIIEIVGDTLLVESLPGTDREIHRGWVTQEELALRTTWTK